MLPWHGSIAAKDLMGRSSPLTSCAMRFCARSWKCFVAIIRNISVIWAAGSLRRILSVSRSWPPAWCCSASFRAPCRSRKLEDKLPMALEAESSSPLLIVGPTAVGKSELALSLAERLGGEIISADSMQVYRGLDIGTAKPTAQEQARVRHHLIDVVDIRERFDAAKFVRLASKAVAEIQSREHLPILCGGTGLYLKAFLEGLGEAPPSDNKLRAELETIPMPALLHELA